MNLCFICNIVGKDEEEDQDKDAGDDSEKKPRLLRSRKNRRERRSTGVINYDEVSS